MKDRGKARIPLENIQSKSGGALLALLKLRSTVLIEYKDVIGVKEVLFFFFFLLRNNIFWSFAAL